MPESRSIKSIIAKYRLVFCASLNVEYRLMFGTLEAEL